MASKVRKQVYIEPHQEAALKRLGKQLGVSEAEIIRQAIDSQLQFLRGSRADPALWEKERQFIRERTSPGSPTQGRTWRRDDLHER